MKRMKRRISLLLAVLLAIQLTAAVPALAADPKITVTFLDAEGNPIGAGTYSYEGTEFDISKLDTYLTSLASAELEALGKAAEVKLETSYTAPEGPEITAEDNAEGKPLTVKVNGSASKIKVAEGANVTFVGDFDAPNNSSGAAIETEGDATVKVTGSVTNFPEYGISAENAVNSSGDEIPNEANITMVGDVKGSEAAVYAEGEAQIKIEGQTISSHNTGILAEENAKVTASVEDAVYGVTGVHTTGDAEVKVEGAVWAETSKELKDEYGNPKKDENGNPVSEHTGTAVIAEDSSKVEVDGRMSGSKSGIVASDSAEVTVTGFVNSSNGPAVVAKNGKDSSGNEVQNDVIIKIGGNVIGNTQGIDAEGEAKITVGGNVSGGHQETYTWTDADGNIQENTEPKGFGIIAKDNAEIQVAQNVSGAQGAILASDGATIRVEGSANSLTGAGIIAPNGEETTNSSKITVNGNVNAYNNGIVAEGEAVVKVGQSVISGHEETFTYTSSDGTEKEKKEYIGTGITASESAKVTAGSVSGSLAAVNAGGNSEVTVHGYAQAKRTGINAFEDSTVVVDGTVRAVRVEEYSYINSNGETVTNTYLAGTGISAADQAKVTAGEVLAGNTAIHTTGHAEVKVQGDAQSLNGVGIYAFNDTDYDTVTGKYVEETTDTKVTVGGDLTSSNTSIRADGEAEIQVDGNVTSLKGKAIDAEGESTVTVGKNVEGTSANLDFNTAVIEVTEGADVTVDGSVHSSKGDAIWIETQPVPNPETYVAEDPEENASITVGGDVTADDGAAIHMTGNADVVVMGNVTGGQLTETEDYDDMTAEEAAVNPYYQARKQAQAEAFSDLDVVEEKHGAVEIESTPDASGKLIINGTVSANGDDIPLVIKVSAGDEELPEEPIELGLPEMKIYELAPGTDGSYFDVDVTLGRSFSYSVEDNGATNQFVTYENEHIALSEEEHAALVETIAAAIQYIIKVDPAYQNGAIKVADEFYDAENDLYAAHEGEEVSVTFSLDSSYELSASGNYTLKDNGDGTWTLTVQRGGGVTLTAVIRRQEQQAEPVSAERVHPAVGKSILFGRYDLDGDEKPEELSWQILRVSGGYARLAMIAGFDEIPGDFDSAFNEWETEQIREGSLQPLDAGRTKELFGDGMVHPSMYVRFDALKLD